MSEQVMSGPFDYQLEALAHVERRRLLFALLEATRRDDAPIELGREKYGAEGGELMVRMAHVHLPKLREMGYVGPHRGGEFDRERLRVDEGPRSDEIRPLLELLEANRKQLPDDWL